MGSVSRADAQAGKDRDPITKGWPATLGAKGAKGVSEFLSRGMMGVTKQGLGTC